MTATFEFRDTHELPTELPAPPDFWDALYDSMLSSDDLPWETLNELHTFCSSFLNPLLDQSLDGDHRWSPENHQWGEPDS